jgi:hypothetical protein
LSLHPEHAEILMGFWVRIVLASNPKSKQRRTLIDIHAKENMVQNYLGNIDQIGMAHLAVPIPQKDLEVDVLGADVSHINEALQRQYEEADRERMLD